MLIETRNSPGETPAKPAKPPKLTKPVNSATRVPRNRWHAVTIVPGAGHCKAVEPCKGRRILSREAPRLPLAECDARECRCKYRHYADRRSGPRRGDAGGPASRESRERRQSRGRRETD
jgi:hypothetical protein